MSHDFSIERSGMNKFSLSLVFIGALLGLSFIMVSISYGQGEDAPEIARQAEVTVVQESAPGEAAFEETAEEPRTASLEAVTAPLEELPQASAAAVGSLPEGMEGKKGWKATSPWICATST